MRAAARKVKTIDWLYRQTENPKREFRVLFCAKLRIKNGEWRIALSLEKFSAVPLFAAVAGLRFAPSYAKGGNGSHKRVVLI